MDKKNLAKWEGEDLQKAKECRWMIEKKYINHFNFFKSRKQALWWYIKFCKHLPIPELYQMKKDLNGYTSFIFDFDNFNHVMRTIRYEMVQKLLADAYEKDMVLEKAAEENNIIRPRKQVEPRLSTIEEYRFKKLTEVFASDSEDYKKQKEEIIAGYKPTYNVLQTQPPIEVIEYCGFKMIKYDKFHGYYSIMIVYPDGKYHITYDTTPNKMESALEAKFDELVNDYLNNNNNPYGNKKFENKVDITNVKNAMGYNLQDNDPLNEKDIF